MVENCGGRKRGFAQYLSSHSPSFFLLSRCTWDFHPSPLLPSSTFRTFFPSFFSTRKRETKINTAAMHSAEGETNRTAAAPSNRANGSRETASKFPPLFSLLLHLLFFCCPRKVVTRRPRKEREGEKKKGENRKKGLSRVGEEAVKDEKRVGGREAAW